MSPVAFRSFFRSPEARKIGLLYGALILINLAVWSRALVEFQAYPALLGTALLAYSFGLRHAVDADHIAAIDNVTRKLMQEGQRPITAGLYFALGHSTIVVLASLAIAFTASALQARFAGLREVGGLVGTGISALFLFAIAGANMLTLWTVLWLFGRGGQAVPAADLDSLLGGGGFLTRLFRRLFSLIRASWQMYPLGFLFGLGFDTATEIGVLGIAAAHAAEGFSIWIILIFPALFTAGMTLIDATDNILMVGAYGWALVNPLRKLYYNVAITTVSILVALAIGSVEVLGLVSQRMSHDSGIWRAIAALNGNSSALGCATIGIFAASWVVCFAIYRWRGIGRHEAESALASQTHGLE